MEVPYTFEPGTGYDITAPMFQDTDAAGNAVGAPVPCENFVVAIQDAVGNFGAVDNASSPDGSWRFVSGDVGATGTLVYTGKHGALNGEGSQAGVVPDVPTGGKITATITKRV